MGMRRVGAGGRAAGDVGVHAQLDGARGPRPHLPAAVHGQHAAPLASAPARGYCDSGLLLLFLFFLKSFTAPIGSECRQ